ncbi:MAG: hypothetical protein HC866_09630 [Leptolyngbyaceae cyanobacterium RU_5_1]|nr:hypothetical protein [Leptolyngbyaceae cyanobacterium RU_5_1]
MRQTLLAVTLFLSSSAFTVLIFNLFAIAPNFSTESYGSTKPEQTTPHSDSNGY